MALFRKVCPRCGRRYPKNFTNCLECSSPLIDTDKEAKKQELKKHLPLIGIVVLCVAILAAVLYFVLPLIQYSLSSGQELGTLSRTAGETLQTTYSMNQPASNGNTQIMVTRMRQGSQSANSRQFLFVTVTLQNLRTDKAVTATTGDFGLVDQKGEQYPALGLGDRIRYEIEPGDSSTFEVVFEVPASVENLQLRYSFTAIGDRAGQDVFFLLR